MNLCRPKVFSTSPGLGWTGLPWRLFNGKSYLLMNRRRRHSAALPRGHLRGQDPVHNATADGLILGGSEQRQVSRVEFDNLKINGRYRTGAENANIKVGPFARDVTFRSQ
jgi:hypothetical protein